MYETVIYLHRIGSKYLPRTCNEMIRVTTYDKPAHTDIERQILLDLGLVVTVYSPVITGNSLAFMSDSGVASFVSVTTWTGV